jgi:hypothetical protein
MSAGAGGSAALAGAGGAFTNTRARAGTSGGRDPDADPIDAGSGGNGSAGAGNGAAGTAHVDAGSPAQAGAGGSNECGRLEIAIETYGSCALDLASGAELDGEAFIDADGRQQRVLALDRWGTGHLMAWCDSSTLVDLVNGVNARRYLGRSNGARVASFGDDFMCNPDSPSAYPLPPWVTYLGLGLPAQYRAAPAALAADWDAVIFCGYRAEWDDAWIPTLQAYVSEHGRGLLAALDYAGVDATPPDFAHMNSLVAPTGVTFLEVLNYQHTASVSVPDECVPDFMPGPD